MRTCKDSQCNIPVTGKQMYCTDRCRKRASRTVNSDKDNSDKQVGQTPTPTRPPCTDKQLSSPCHACDEVKTCTYLHGMSAALPGQEGYNGVCQDRQGVLQPA